MESLRARISAAAQELYLREGMEGFSMRKVADLGPTLKQAIFDGLESTFGVTLPTTPGLDTLACMLNAHVVKNPGIIRRQITAIVTGTAFTGGFATRRNRRVRV